MKQAFMVKYQTKQGGTGTAVTTQVMANSSAEAKAEVQRKNQGCTIISVTAK